MKLKLKEKVLIFVHLEIKMPVHKRLIGLKMTTISNMASLMYVTGQDCWHKVTEGRQQHSCIQSQELGRSLFQEVFTHKRSFELYYSTALLYLHF